jgi:hypothetical protein
MESKTATDFQKELVFTYRQKGKLVSLIWGILVVIIASLAMIYAQKYWYGVFLALGASSIWRFFFPGTNKLIVKNGYAWPWSLYSKMKDKNRIRKMKTLEDATSISTEKKTYPLHHLDLSLEEKKNLEALAITLKEGNEK